MCIRLYDFAGHCESLVFLEFWCSACYVFSHHWVWVSCVQGTLDTFWRALNGIIVAYGNFLAV